MFSSRPLRCPRCRPVASEVHLRDGSPVRGWTLEATYVGFLAMTPFEGYKRAPAACPACGSLLMEVS